MGVVREVGCEVGIAQNILKTVLNSKNNFDNTRMSFLEDSIAADSI